MKLFYTLIGMAIFFFSFVLNSNAQDFRIVKDLEPGIEGAFDNPESKILGTLGNEVYLYQHGDDGFKLYASNGSMDDLRLFYNYNGGQVTIENVFLSNDSLIILNCKSGSETIIFKISNSIESPQKYIPIAGEFITDVVMLNQYLYGMYKVSSFDLEFTKFDMDNQTQEVIRTFDPFGGRKFVATNGTKLFVMVNPDNNSVSMALYTLIEDKLEFVKVLNTGIDASRNYEPIFANDQLYFWYHPNNDPYELWTSDGTEEGTKVIYSDLRLDVFASYFSKRAIFSHDNKVYFTGTPIDECSNCHEVFAVNTETNVVQKLEYDEDDTEEATYFVAYNNNVYCNIELWFGEFMVRTNGTPEGTERVAGSTIIGRGPIEMTNFTDSLVYSAVTSEAGREPMFYSDKGSLIRKVIDVNPGSESSNPRNFTAIGNKLFFLADDGISGTELFVLQSGFGVSTQNMVVEEFNVFPNPAQNVIEFELPDFKFQEVRLMNTMGQIMDVQVDLIGASKFKIDISNMPSGVYYLELTSGVQKAVSKYIKR